MAATAIEGLRVRRWTRREYERLIDLGVFREDEPIELLDGHLVVKEPPGAPHAIAVELVLAALQRVFHRGWRIRPGLPIALDRTSEPEPDFSVLRGNPRDSERGHPAQPVLVVEIAATSLPLDRLLKARLYARAGIPEYWIVDVKGRALEVYRRPSGSVRIPRYRSVRRLGPRDSLVPLGAPRRRVRVAALLP